MSDNPMLIDVKPLSFITISPTITLDGEVHEPLVDIYWDMEKKCVDARYEGEVSDAAKRLMDNFAEQLWVYFQEQLEATTKEQGGCMTWCE